MKAFAYERAGDAAAAVEAAANGATYLGGGTNLVDLMKLGVAEPTRLIDVSRLPHDSIEETRNGAAHRRRGPQHRPRHAPADPRALPPAQRGRSRRRVRPAPQPRDRRRQPPPAHALQLLPGRHEAVQQAPPRLGLPRARGRAPQPRDPRPLRALRRHPPLGHGGRAGRDRRERPRARRQRRAHDPDPRPAPAARRQAAARHRPQRRRPDHRRRARRARPTIDVSEGPRPGELRVRGVLRRRGGRVGGRRGEGSADRARRRRPRAVAGGAGGGPSSAAGSRPPRRSPRRPKRSSRLRSPSATTPSKCSWRTT